MRRGIFCILLQALTITSWALLLAHAGAAQSDSHYPYQGQTQFTLTGIVGQVDIDRDQITVSVPNGQPYTVDMSESKVVLNQKTGEIEDLAPGMRVRIYGTLLTPHIVASDQLRVVSFQGVRPTGPVSVRSTTGIPAPGIHKETDIDLRGTVESVDDDRGSFVVHINTHTRTIYTDDNTLFHGGVDLDDDTLLPARPRDRVTVNGVLRSDGTVLAKTVSITPAPPATSADSNDNELFGHVSGTSNPLISRDIKVRISADREVTVHVPHNIPIQRDGRDISVHDLSKDDIVKVYGVYDDDGDFDAGKIDVVSSGGGDE